MSVTSVMLCVSIQLNWIYIFLFFSKFDSSHSADKILQGSVKGSVPSPKMEFVIKTTWDGRQVPNADFVKIRFLHPITDDGEVVLTVDAPFYGDEPPNAPVGPLFRLWDYEVVEVFILGDDNRYLEIEVGPHGHHLVLLLDGYRNVKVHSLDLKYEWTVVDKRWTAKAFIPRAYFPKGSSKLNCYAIHGQGDKRIYSSLFPTEPNKFQEPEFHRLEYFQEANFSKLLPGIENETSQLWKRTLEEDATANN